MREVRAKLVEPLIVEGRVPPHDLDAEAAVQGARTLLLQSLFDLRVSRASLDLATGTPIEGVKP